MPSTEQVVWVIVAVVVVIGSAVVRRKAMAKMDRQAGRRPDGSYPEGRGLEDMTPLAKVAAGITVAAFAVTAVLRFVDKPGPWFWVSCIVGIAAAIVVGVSEKRRTRREGLEPLD